MKINLINHLVNKLKNQLHPNNNQLEEKYLNGNYNHYNLDKQCKLAEMVVEVHQVVVQTILTLAKICLHN